MKFRLVYTLTIAVLFHQGLFSQIDIFDYDVVGASVGYRSTFYENYYAVVPHSIYNGNSQPGVSYPLKDYLAKDNGTGISTLLNYIKFYDNGLIDANGEGVIYYITLVLNGKFQDENESKLSKFFTTKSNKLSQSSYNSTIDRSLDTRFWNYNVVDIYLMFGKKLVFGPNFSIKYIGINGSITYYSDDNPQVSQRKEYVNMDPLIFDGRVLLGPAFGYRSNFGEYISLYTSLGANFCANFNHPNIKLNYNPHGKAQLYFGKDYGLFIGVNYDMVKSTYYYGEHLGSNMRNEGNNPMLAKTLDAKVGFYYKAGWFRRLLK